jgi:argininosuccinate lyase
MGAAALSTSGFPISRERVAELLGFDGLVENSYDAIGAADYVAGAASAAELTALDTGRMVQELLLWCHQEYGILKVADPYVQISSIMPQKRNPVSLEHSRALLSSVAAKAHAVLQMVHNTPFGDIVDTEDDMQPHLWSALDAMTRIFNLLTGVVATVEVDREHLLEQARTSFANVTELADLLVREFGLPFRTAHHVVSTLVKEATRRGITDVRHVDAELAEEAAHKVLGRPLGITAEQLRLALDPVNFVEVRRVRGGVNPDEVRRMITERQKRQVDLETWLQGARQQLADAGAKLDRACTGLGASV